MLRATDPTEPATGKMLILDNEHTLEGDIERVGTQYRIRHVSVGGEEWIPGERVLRLCPDAMSAYLYLRSRSNLNDADERRRLAEWCRQHGLREQALAEMREVVRLRPQDVASCRLLANLQQAPKTPATKLAMTRSEEPEVLGPPVDLTSDAMGQFVTRVQPILMNTCASCHASGKGGAFKLIRCYESEGSNRKVMQHNLTAVLSQVNLREPRISPLLIKAVSVHGELSQAPLKDRRSPAFHTLEEWVKLTLANNPQLFDNGASPSPEHSTSEQQVTSTQKSEAEFASDAGRPAAVRTPATPPPASSSSKADAPAKPAAPDPFDPSDFNRQAHPEKSTPAAPPQSGPKPS